MVVQAVYLRADFLSFFLSSFPSAGVVMTAYTFDLQTTGDGAQIGTSGLFLRPTTGTRGAGTRLSIAAPDPAANQSAEVELTPGVVSSGMESQIIFFGKTGDNYERFTISQISGETRIDSTANHAGNARNIIVIMGGKEATELPGLLVLQRPVKTR